MGLILKKIDNQKFQLEQTLVPPIFYFDHWAIRKFSQNINLQDRFINSLKKLDGTLLISHINLFEFGAMTNPYQAKEIESFFNKCLPNLAINDFASDPGFIFSNPKQKDLHSPNSFWLLDHMTEVIKINQGKLTFSSFVTEIIKNHNQFQILLDDFKSNTVEAIKAVRSDPVMQLQAKNLKVSKGLRLPGILFQEFIRLYHLNEKEKFNPNDTLDMLHIIPAYGMLDYLLVDNAWSVRISKVKKRFRDAGLTCSHPIVFTDKGNGITDFLKYIESK